MLIWLVSFVKQGGNIGNLFSALSWPSTLEVLRLNHNQFEGEWKVNTERLPENVGRMPVDALFACRDTLPVVSVLVSFGQCCVVVAFFFVG